MISLGGLQFPSILILSVSYCLRAWFWGKVFPSSSDLNVTDSRIADRASLFLINAHLLLDGKGWDYIIPYPFCCSCLWEALTRFFFHFILCTGRCLKLYYFCWSKDKLLSAILFAQTVQSVYHEYSGLLGTGHLIVMMILSACILNVFSSNLLCIVCESCLALLVLS